MEHTEGPRMDIAQVIDSKVKKLKLSDIGEKIFSADGRQIVVGEVEGPYILRQIRNKG